MSISAVFGNLPEDYTSAVIPAILVWLLNIREDGPSDFHFPISTSHDGQMYIYYVFYFNNFIN